MQHARLTRGQTLLLILALPLAACGTTGAGEAVYRGADSTPAAAGTAAGLDVPGTGTTDPGARFVDSSQPIGGLTVETAPVDLGGPDTWPPAPTALPQPMPVRRGTVPPRPPPPPLNPSGRDPPGQPIR